MPELERADDRVVLEPRSGGRFYEVTSHGYEASWGEVLVYDRPCRIVVAWKPSPTDGPPTEVEVTFTPDSGGTRVGLEHRGWERLGELADEQRESYRNGWPLVLDQCYVVSATAEVM